MKNYEKINIAEIISCYYFIGHYEIVHVWSASCVVVVVVDVVVVDVVVVVVWHGVEIEHVELGIQTQLLC